MIVVRAPLRISFVGGGTDMPDFYRRFPGRVISTTIDKYIHIVINRAPFSKGVSVRYSITESVAHPRELRHTRIKAALLDLGIEGGIEIGSFGDLPSKTGLGSSSSFSVALMKALHAYQGRNLSPVEAAEAASRLEIELVGEPIGKQDQYAAAHGGLNVFQFNPDESVDVDPVLLGFRQRLEFERHVLLFFTGITRSASSVLSEQKENIAQEEKFRTMVEMTESVLEFRARLLRADFRGLGRMLHEAWEKKKTLASKVSNPLIDELYYAGRDAGAWGGKVLGAGGGGCILFLAPPDAHQTISQAVRRIAAQHQLNEFKYIPIRFVQCGTEILFNGDHYYHEIV